MVEKLKPNVVESGTKPTTSKARQCRALRLRSDRTPRVLSRVLRSSDSLKPGLRSKFTGLLRGQLPWPLYLYGEVGRGKTCAALCLHDTCENVLYWTLDQLMRVAYDDVASIWWYSEKADLVIVDEIGDRAIDYGREYAALKRMADLRDQRPVMWVSNLAPAALQGHFDDRIESRLTCGTVVCLDDVDRRRLPTDKQVG